MTSMQSLSGGTYSDRGPDQNGLLRERYLPDLIREPSWQCRD